MIEKLKKEFEEHYFTQISTTKGLESLAENIGISKNSLRRFLGKLNGDTQLRVSTLNLISHQLGYQNFQDFCDNSENKNVSIDFDTLGIYYGVVKGKGNSVTENHFQNASYYFAKKVIENPDNLKEFIKRFADNQEALEYVLAWHPSYSRIADEDYQEALLKLAKITNRIHVKVFANSFVYFGKFMTKNWNFSEAENHLKLLEKQVKKMRMQNSFMAFPEARFAIVKILHSSFSDGKIGISEIMNECLPQDISYEDQFIYTAYVSDILNVLGFFVEAKECFKNLDLSSKRIKTFEKENPHFIHHVFLMKVNYAAMFFHNAEKQKAQLIFDELLNEIQNPKRFCFDSKDYFLLRFYQFAQEICPENVNYKKMFDELVKTTKFTFFSQF